jgi:hypothetical protein
MTLEGYHFAMELGGDREETILVQARWLRQTFPA